MKEMSNVHSRCRLIKQSLDAKIEELTGEQSQVQDEMESIHRELSSMTISHHSEQTHREKAEKEVEEAQQYVLEQHKLSFTKSLQQAEYFYKIRINDGNFDVMKDFYKGKLILVRDIPDDDEDNKNIPAKNNKNREDNELDDID
ncbi:hypothetical protein VNO80_01034 [Phaseolus coccineus]|uniref:Uncharacterized protein n=1 Tax=Phaseolus coccineus TaxID=3886 RepID=A0AAN9NZG4_PHACN